MVVALLLAAWAFGLVLANRPPGISLLAGGALLEALLIGFLIGGIVHMAGSNREFARVSSSATYWRAWPSRRLPSRGHGESGAGRARLSLP
jgi:hypothetical protein